MKNKLTFLILFVFLPLALVYPDPRAADAGDDKGKVHIVIKGDTLWDLSEEYLGNPFLWPKLWQWNSYISNPHFIYPGNPVKLYPPRVMVRRPAKKVVEERPLGLVEEKGVAEEIAETLPGVEEETYAFAEMRSSGFIDNEEMKAAGEIIEAEDEKILLSDGDILYVTLTDGGKAGDLYTIFRTDKEIIHPATEKSLGYKIITLGFAEITGFSKDLAIARITKSFDAVNRGDLLKPKENIPGNITLKPSAMMLDGYITAVKGDRTTFGERDVVYIDLGKKDGLERGNSFIVYKEGETVKDSSEEKSYTLPPVTIGRLLVLIAKEENSVAIILKSVEEMRVGQKIKSELN